MSGFDWTPTLVVLAIGALLAALPLAWFASRQRGRRTASERLRALSLLALFLTFDLVLVGAFTRLSDSGLGCPDWPGCYGHASPIGARADIAAAEAAVPDGAVTHAKAWIEMAHRYMATAVGAVILVLAVRGLVAARRRAITASPWLGLAALVWVVVQGLFGAFTVTLRLYPAIVTLHLLGGFVLLALLAMQAEELRPRTIEAGRGVRALLLATVVAATVQMALGGWVSTNYAVLACQEFPRCQGGWWPEMAWNEGFGVLRELGRTDDGSGLPFPALTAIHMAHRLGAAVVLPLLLLLGWRLLASRSRDARPWAMALFGIAAWQTASGLANVLLEWPLAAALGHTGGAAALVVVLAILAVRLRRAALAHPAPTAFGGRLEGAGTADQAPSAAAGRLGAADSAPSLTGGCLDAAADAGPAPSRGSGRLDAAEAAGPVPSLAGGPLNAPEGAPVGPNFADVQFGASAVPNRRIASRRRSLRDTAPRDPLAPPSVA